MKKIILLSAMASAMLTSFAAQAAESAVLKVVGVIRPPACNVNFPGGDTVDYKVIKSDKLNKTGFTDLDPKEVAMVLDCGNKMQVGFSIVDNKSASRLIGLFGTSNGQNFGLGMQGDKKVGGYRIDMINNLADAVSANAISGTSRSGPWANDTAVKQDRFHALSTGATANPVSTEKFSTTLKIYTRLNEAKELNLNQDVPLDGMATVQVEYL